MVSAAAGNRKAFGIDRAANPWADIDGAEVVWIDHDFIENHTVGFDEVAKEVHGWTPARTSEVTGIAEKQIRQAAEWWRQASTSFLMHARGIEHHSHGVDAYEIFRKIDRGEIRGLASICFNPRVSLPDNNFIQRCLEKLDFYVAIDFFLNETARRLSSYRLPTCASRYTFNVEGAFPRGDCYGSEDHLRTARVTRTLSPATPR